MNSNHGNSNLLELRKLEYRAEDRLMKQRLIALHHKQLGKRQFDILHIQTPFVAHYAGVKLARKLNIPVIETYHTCGRCRQGR